MSAPKVGTPAGLTRVLCVRCGEVLAELVPSMKRDPVLATVALECSCGHEQESRFRGELHRLVGAVGGSERKDRRIWPKGRRAA